MSRQVATISLQQAENLADYTLTRIRVLSLLRILYLIIVNWYRVMHKVANDHQGLFSFGLELVFGHLSFLCLLFQRYTFLLQLAGILLLLHVFAAEWLWVAMTLARDVM